MKKTLFLLAGTLLCSSAFANPPSALSAPSLSKMPYSVVGDWRGYAVTYSFSTPKTACHSNYHITFMKGGKAHVVRTITSGAKSDSCNAQDFTTTYTRSLMSVKLNLSGNTSGKCTITLRKLYSMTQGKELMAAGYFDTNPKTQPAKRIRYFMNLFTDLPIS